MAAKENNIDLIVRITSDCLCIDEAITDLIIDDHINKMADYTSISLVRTYPHGLDVEVFNFNVLEKSLEEELKEAIKILDLQDLNKARDFLKESL